MVVEPVHAVLQTVELLEHILTYLDTAALVRTQRVNTYWQQVIADSKKLRRVMFLEPEEAREVIEGLDDERLSTTRLHPLLQGMPQNTIDHKVSPKIIIVGFGIIDGEDLPRIDINDLLDARCSAKTLVSQPPPQYVRICYPDFDTRTLRVSGVASEKGVTMVAVQEELSRIMREQTEKRYPRSRPSQTRKNYRQVAMSLHLGLTAASNVTLMSQQELEDRQQEEREYLQAEHDSENDQ